MLAPSTDRVLLTAVLAATLFALLPGQTSVVRAETDFGVYGQGTIDWLPAGSVAVPSLDVVARGSQANCAMSATVHGPHHVGLRCRGTGYTFPQDGTAWAGTADRRLGAPNQLLWTLQGSGEGELVVQVHAQLRLLVLAQMEVFVDAFDDGEIEVRATSPGVVSARIPVRFTSQLPVKIGIELHHWTPWPITNESFDVLLDVRFEPTPRTAARASSYGSECGGAMLTARDDVVRGIHDLELVVDGAYPAQPVVWVVGATRIAEPIARSGCELLVWPFDGFVTTADATGRTAARLELFGALRGVAMLQALPFDATTSNDFRATAGVELTFAD